MTNRVSLLGAVLAEPKSRTLEARGGTIEIVSLWIEVKDEHRTDRFSVEINCPKAIEAAKAMKQGVLAEIAGVLRHDRWKDKKTGQWTGKIYIAIDPGLGTVRSKGFVSDALQSPAV
jgi:single-stranded DNA-binding protein